MPPPSRLAGRAATSLPREVSAVVFDCDGLLVDTEGRWTVAETALFARHGLPYGPDEKATFVGLTVPDAAAVMAVRFDRVGEEEAIGQELRAGAREAIAEQADPMPGAVEIVALLTGRVPFAVASNSPRDLLDVALSRSGLADQVQVTVAFDEVAHGKPAPDLYLRACELLDADVTRAVAFEDSPTGVASARAAGMFVVGIPGHHDTLDADLVLDSLADPELVGWARGLTS